MSKPARGRPRWLLPLILSVVIASALGVYAFYDYSVNPMPNSIALTGTVSRVSGENVTKITFQCQTSGNDFVSDVLGGNPGTYAVTLPNGHSYKVTIVSGSSGNSSDVGTLDLYSREASLERNWVG